MTALSELLNELPVTARQAALIAEEKGIDLPYGTLSGYWAGNHGKPAPDTLSKLAEVVPVPLSRLQEAAWTSTAPLGPYVPPQESVHLNFRQRKAIDALILSMVKPDEGRMQAEVRAYIREHREELGIPDHDEPSNGSGRKKKDRLTFKRGADPV